MQPRLHTFLVAAIVGVSAMLYSVREVAAVTVYSNDFSVSAGSEWSDSTISTSNGEQFLATSPNGSGNGTDTLSLSALPGHSSVTVTFDLYIIQSWDGNGPNGGGVDAWQLTEDGGNLLLTTFANFTGGNTQSYPVEIAPYGPGALNAPRTGAFDAGHLGYGTGDFGDATYRLSFTFAHSSSSLALAFNSLQNQGVGDEGWGLDNVSVSVTGVPEPSTVALSLAAACCVAVGAIRRKRRTRA